MLLFLIIISVFVYLFYFILLSWDNNEIIIFGLTETKIDRGPEPLITAIPTVLIRILSENRKENCSLLVVSDLFLS